jgi:2-polyprenyl-3-methyl-5-hydroxy-6-metoxy-1,4-benzoquinol methylase
MEHNNKDVVLCPVCGSKNQKTLYPDTLGDDLPPFDYAFSPDHMRTYKVVKCESCSHAFCIIPHKNLWENYQSVVDSEYLSRQDAHLLTARKVVEVLIKFIDGGKLLDIGCATGDFLSVAQEHYSVEGLELSRWSSEIAKKRGFKIHTCPINELPSDTKFDVVTLWGVIEHFESPKAEIEKISSVLKPGGHVCLWTGDIDSWLARLLGKNWWYIQGQHIQFFSKKSLNRLFLDTGFKNVTIEKYPFTANLYSLSKSFFRYKKIKSITKILFENKVTKDMVITLKLPGEMLAIYEYCGISPRG